MRVSEKERDEWHANEYILDSRVIAQTVKLFIAQDPNIHSQFINSTVPLHTLKDRRGENKGARGREQEEGSKRNGRRRGCIKMKPAPHHSTHHSLKNMANKFTHAKRNTRVYA